MTLNRVTHAAFPLMLLLVILLGAGNLAAEELKVPATPNPHAFPSGARAYGMGGAFVAVVDDASALYWNPAALADSRFGLLVSAGARDVDNIEELSEAMEAVEEEEEDAFPEGGLEGNVPLSALVALTVGRVGLGAEAQGWIDAHIHEQPVTVDLPEELDEDLTDEDLPDSLPAGSADVAYLGAARLGLGVPVLSLGSVGSLSLGVAGSYYVTGERMVYVLEPEERVIVDGSLATTPGTETYPVNSTTEYTFTSVQGYAVDLGLKAQVTPWITVGAVARDVVSELNWEGTAEATVWELQVTDDGAELSADVEETTSDPEAVLVHAGRTPTYQVGVAITPPLLGLTLAADLDSEQVAHLGAEWRIFGILDLRAGYLTRMDGDGTLPEGYGSPVRVGLGLGLPFLHLNAAAGFASTDDLSTVQDAQLELSLRF